MRAKSRMVNLHSLPRSASRPTKKWTMRLAYQVDQRPIGRKKAKWPTRRLWWGMSPELRPTITNELHPRALRYLRKKPDRDKRRRNNMVRRRGLFRAPPNSKPDYPHHKTFPRAVCSRFPGSRSRSRWSLITSALVFSSGARPYQQSRCIGFNLPFA